MTVKTKQRKQVTEKSFSPFPCKSKYLPIFAKSCSETSNEARERMKRESGETPEQSRCCEPHPLRIELALILQPLPKYERRWEGKSKPR